MDQLAETRLRELGQDQLENLGRTSGRTEGAPAEAQSQFMPEGRVVEGPWGSDSLAGVEERRGILEEAGV